MTDEVNPMTKTRLFVVCHLNNGLHNTERSLRGLPPRRRRDRASDRTKGVRRFGSNS